MSRVSPRQHFNNKKPRTHEQKPENIFSDKNDVLELKLFLFVLRHKKISLYLQLVMLILNICAFAFCIRGKFLIYHQIKGFNKDVVGAVNCLSDFLLMTTTVFGLTGLNKTSFFVELLNFVLKKKNRTGQRKNNTRISLMRYIQILRILPLIPTIINVCFFISQVGWHVQQYFLPRDIWYYLLNLAVCSAIILIYKIKESFNDINDDLEQLFTNDAILFIPEEVPHRPLKIGSKLENLMDLTRNYTILCNLLHKFNCYAKGHLVLVMLSITINILFNVTVIVEFALKPNISILAAEAKTTALVLQAMLAIVSMIQAAVAACVGESLEEEGERTSRICYTFLNKLNRNLKTDRNKELIHEVKFLLDLSKSRKIHLHAGGFFKLNWGIIASIISAVATYSIVIIQFLLK